MKNRIDTLERREASTEEMIEAKIRERERKLEGRRRYEEKIKAEIEEEECKIMVTRFEIGNKSEEEVVHDAIQAMMKDGTSPKIVPIVEWMKKENAGKPSLVLLNAGSSQNRDHILRNLKGNKSFIVSKSFPARYKEAKAKLNEMGSAL